MPKKILIVEDDDIARAGLAELLREEQHTVVVASTGEQAVQSFLENRPNVVLLDYLLPDIDGFTVLRRMRAADHGTPVVIMSASADFVDGELCGHEASAREAGAAGYLIKPLDFDELFSTLERF
jgi:DNA-binding response OmpR family regulator